MTKRKLYLDRLMNILSPQLTDEVEVLIEIDNGEKTIGEKRNNLLERSKGRYIAFIDDDDVVESFYVKEILVAINKNPDVVGLALIFKIDGVLRGTALHTIKHDHWWEEFDGELYRYFRNPNHLNPVKREFALITKFPSINYEEDRDYSKRIYEFLKTEVMIERPIYQYLYRTNKTVETSNVEMYISGELLQTQSKWNLDSRYPIRMWKDDELSEGDTVFMKISDIPLFLSLKPKKKVILLIHNSDESFTEEEYNKLKPYVNIIKTVNCDCDFAEQIPLGFVDNQYAPHSVLNEIKTEPTCERDIFCYVNFCIKTNFLERTNAMEYFGRTDFVTIDESLPRKPFYRNLKRSRFVICPPGMGIDTHRVYESLFFGAIPIVKTSFLDKMYTKYFPMIIIVKDWKEVTREFLEMKSNKFISFSLWGNNPMYTIGAVKNADLALRLYPDWKCVFYCFSTVPDEIISQLESRENVIVRKIQGEYNDSDSRGMFNRFFVAEENIECVIFRDTDSRLSKREVLAVNDWIKSGKDLHVMRDHPYHPPNFMPILGGMWGVRGEKLKDIKKQIYDFGSSSVKGQDQIFLKDYVWKKVTDGQLSVQIHDPLFEKKPFPECASRGEYNDGVWFVGQSFDENDKPSDQSHIDLIKSV